MIKAAQDLAGYFARHAERPSFKASTPPPPPAAGAIRPDCLPGAELPGRKSVISRQSHVSAWNLRDSGRPAGLWPRIGAPAAGRESTRLGRLVSI
jgi:hypothetical protein